MDNKKIANLCLLGGAAILVLAVLIRLGNVTHLTELPFHGLWKVSAGLLLVSMAVSVKKD